jgi:hypothetical protein
VNGRRDRNGDRLLLGPGNREEDVVEVANRATAGAGLEVAKCDAGGQRAGRSDQPRPGQTLPRSRGSEVQAVGPAGSSDPRAGVSPEILRYPEMRNCLTIAAMSRRACLSTRSLCSNNSGLRHLQSPTFALHSSLGPSSARG